MNNKLISVAVPTFNRFDLLKACVGEIINDPRVGEVVITDDCSMPNIYDNVKQWAAQHENITLHRNVKNLDCYANKAHAVSLCHYDRVILFDSDNLLSKHYIDKLYEQFPWEDNTVYCPTFAMPHFDYTQFNGSIISKSTVRHLMDNDTFKTALNTANYFVPREAYLQVFNPNIDPHTADSIYMAYRFLEAGYQLAFIKDLHYYHRVHDGSHYKNNVHKTGNQAAQIEMKLKGLK